MLTIEEVKKIAKLARIDLTPEEESRHADTISVVLDYMKILDEVDTTNVEPTAQVTGLSNIVREDITHECTIKKELLAQMPQVDQNELVVPAVFE
ncbi:MAG: Aspartyl/glutamyl-tRNA(Asn/Gln) amidotransferase subunit C [Candidatus Magasanikbacteria bacterium GW2011_GWC2_34_16]|uniref:Aspartyl/glutamyl-tRNA(Asn/Gln) amidotransferase subunit C n=2 Tax=Candidatus Magasanikiibacteriota TaxID=1752731 RepID=A0A0G0HD50_9BACT|nr:MAG: Aspartyl/glutamyl-tRNA(Asn/Gln) amidotransferase subunit C [Candidatus Magasanikbacteria bacterium GW2011_GWC2_34_16]KKQ41083.1 MAG: Aspartyl/glutamyl-tRNA(Asn/Gln) amidotransferase subunit C [Candidatus Magasanikbacteria bacterium GW2011_GWA2_37_8]